jgi:ElaB/YqjD/DUF883 family membrane-anchored ribosome-binding protein
MNTPLDPAELKSDLKDAATHIASEVEERAGELKDKAGDLMDRACCAVREKSCCASTKAQELIRRKPLPAVVGFAALGFAIGYMMCRSRHRAIFDSDELASVFTPLGKRLRHGFQDLKDRGTDVFESVQSRVPHHAVDRVVGQARDLGKTLKFW